ncbi:HsdM family class I SAM-dependent methyltransferase [Tenacibaculum maritimum]|uniref:HsdM family class I SAM-dependent methyltransferase n=1 Tax=Tenacibaculum maritimum TaxID=107401 RepID=UPI0012E4EAC8|nr:N-6 DNA methylase [Tenacibaculum maritimum]CAA0147107.1 putative restriction type II methylase [Tenacibaculum maritimum]CAA0189784.1 putative restriction type II methylase [Tenacibaculum maritimum]CAA0192631.1 putative restriction type II methylase [Tenacibaculum maritimum]CAA0199849.1 putative restriction type II methylase [Tenacibaculum maritimum]CAA0217785.1 putative restriction type II methylase [Tenacibaculum maritimum]
MKKIFENIVKKHSEDNVFLDQLFTSVYLYSRGIYDVKNEFIKDHLLEKDHELVLSVLPQIGSELSTQSLIELFEIAIPRDEQQTNGAVYTPDVIKDYIVDSTLTKFIDKLDTVLVADISCGCGAFLYSSAKKLKHKTEQPYRDIFSQLYGLDISSNSLQRAKILLSLLAIVEGEDEEGFSFNLFEGNALNFDWHKISSVKNNKGFDIVVGNPPYVRAKHIDSASKKLLKNWKVASSGNPDLYLPFFEIGMRWLNSNGVLGYITVNSFFKSVNARGLRNYLSNNEFPLTIINFGHEQIFEKRLTYTCICFIDKQNDGNVSYTKATSKDLLNKKSFNYSILNYNNLNHHRGWLLNNTKIVSNINRIENAGPSLDQLYSIKNGIATLSNDVYIFKPINEDDSNYYFIKDKKEYSVEKTICREIIKPNILKTENEIDEIKEKIIYPYTNGIAPLSLLKESKLQDEFPLAYNYLLDYKSQLDERDKGNGDYGAWFAFGRTQALNDKGLKLLFPYMAKKPHFVFTNNSDMLIYCGYAIFSESEEELLILKRILESDVFDYYMKNTSKPYSSGYYSYAKNYVKHFGVCELSDREKTELLSFNSKKRINQFVSDKYEILI